MGNGASGDRPWLTMLHGFSQDHSVFDRQQAAFAPRYNVAALDLLGHGSRQQRASGFALQDYARDVLAQLDARGIARTHLWGTHTGAAVGLLLAPEAPQRIASLILEGAVAPGLDMPVVTARMARARAIAAKDSVAAAMADWFDAAEYFRAMRENPQAFRAAEHRSLVLRFTGAPLLDALPPPPASVLDRLPRIACPVLLYNGGEDVEDFKRCAAMLERELPRAERVELAGLGSFPAWEAPDRVNVQVDRFLTRIIAP